jgi:hypothetical protein
VVDQRSQDYLHVRAALRESVAELRKQVPQINYADTPKQVEVLAKAIEALAAVLTVNVREQRKVRVA